MNQKSGGIVLTLFFLAAIPACIYPIYDSIVIIKKINDDAQTLGFDTGSFYLLFMSLMITIKVVEWLSVKNKGGFAAQHAGVILLSNFITVAILAPVLSFGMVWHLESSGYVKCADPTSISRISRGESYIFKFKNCGTLTEVE
jgi:hypothetical protein